MKRGSSVLRIRALRLLLWSTGEALALGSPLRGVQPTLKGSSGRPGTETRCCYGFRTALQVLLMSDLHRAQLIFAQTCQPENLTHPESQGLIRGAL